MPHQSHAAASLGVHPLSGVAFIARDEQRMKTTDALIRVGGASLVVDIAVA